MELNKEDFAIRDENGTVRYFIASYILDRYAIKKDLDIDGKRSLQSNTFFCKEIGAESLIATEIPYKGKEIDYEIIFRNKEDDRMTIEMSKEVFINIEISPFKLREIADKIEHRNKNGLPGQSRFVETFYFDNGEIRFLCKGKVN